MKKAFVATGVGIGALAIILSGPATARAHCDTMDGPVVKAARKALETGDVKGVLIWVQEQDERAIATAFTETLAVRQLGPEARALADRYFFETLVRIHRAGEGAPYTGLKPSGLDLGPAVPAADRAIETGNLKPLLSLLTKAVHDGLLERFAAVKDRKNFPADDVGAGRAYVAAYVPFIHYVERLYGAAVKAVHGHLPEEEAGREEE